LFEGAVDCLILRAVERSQRQFDADEFRRTVLALVYDEPIEDGVRHPAEDVIDSAYASSPSECFRALSLFLNEHYASRSSISATLLRCIGRMAFEKTQNWGLEIAKKALHREDAEIRDSGIRALENWGNDRCVEILRSHCDSEPWLDEYAKQVVADLTQPVQ
jgi:hypothetical protein